LQSRLKRYDGFTQADRPLTQKPILRTQQQPALGLGRCPVASERTRCCNLLTLDAVEKCGFDCSYCSIQSFYHGNEVVFDSGFADKLAKLKLDPDTIYHIGTGQSSDSLMWGNHQGVLEALCVFAENNPNVILELKTKSKNIGWLLKNPVPRNVICTWSLNPQTIIDHEEHLSASL
jgi:spore photoproduct lyase